MEGEQKVERSREDQIKETAWRDGVKIHRDDQGGYYYAEFERRNQMFGICTAIRMQLWDKLDKGELPARISWQIEG